MNKVVLINFADERYKEAQKLNTWSGRHIAKFDEVYEYSMNDIDANFKDEHADIFQMKRGNGLWLWKPYLIKKALDTMKMGDILFYCDSGACFFRGVKGILLKLEHQDIWLSALPLKEKQFTKKLTFELLDCNYEEYKETAQVSGTFCAFRKSDFSSRFIEEWLQCCCNIGALAPSDDETLEESYFFAHREDQSILSLLAKKYGLMVWSDPSQYGRLPEKYIRPGCEMVYYGGKPGTTDYPICILHHRTKEGNKKVLFNQFLCAVLPRKVGLKLIKHT